jgi:myosin heavy subunit
MNVQNKKFNKNNDENEKLRDEIKKIKEENEKLKNKLDTQKENLEGRSPLASDNKKLMDELSKLNEKNKEIEHQLKEKQNLIEEYEYEIKILKEKEKEKEEDKDKGKEADSKENAKLIEENKRLQAEREKFIKYINELNEYDERVIAEYKKVKAQLQIEIQKNNLNKNNATNVKKYFTNRELGIISNKMINIVTSQNKKQTKNKKSENVIDFMDSVEIMNTKPEGKDEMTQTQEESNYYKDFYDENKGSYKGSLNSNTKQSIRDSRDEKKYKKNKLSLKNEDYIDENKKKNKIGFNDDEEEFDWDNFIPRNKREESLKRAMKRLEYKRKRDEEKNRFRKSEKITGMAEDLEEVLNKGDDRHYMDEDYEQNRYDEEEEYDDNYYE